MFSGSTVWLTSAKLNRWLGFSVTWCNTEDVVWGSGHYGQFGGKESEKKALPSQAVPLPPVMRRTTTFKVSQDFFTPSLTGCNLGPVCSPIVCCSLQSAWTSSSCTRDSVCRTVPLTSMLRTSTASPATQTARTATGQTLMTAQSVPAMVLSSTKACVLKSVLKGLTMKKPLKTVKVGSCCFPHNGTEIQVCLVKDCPKRDYMCQLVSLSVSWRQRK